MEKPKQTGIHVFRGLRLSPSGMFCSEKCEVVRVVEDKKLPEWSVLYIGSSTRYPLSLHKGTWEYLGDNFCEE